MSQHIISGRNAVLEALRAGGRVNRVYLASDGKVPGKDDILNTARAAGAPFEFIPLAKLNTLAGAVDHQGVAAAVSPVAYAELDEVTQRLGPRALILVLDEIQNPKNLGMILRTAAGAGVDAVLLPQRGGALLDAEVLRASAGAVVHVPVVQCANLGQALRLLKDHEFWVYGLDASAKNNVLKYRWPARTVLIAGSETQGMRPGTRKLCDDFLAIPLANGLDSLNVAVSTGIALFQARQGMQW